MGGTLYQLELLKIINGQLADVELRIKHSINGSCEESIETYNGFMLVSPEDTLIIYLRHNTTRENVQIMSLDMDAAAFDGDAIKYFFAISYQNPIEVMRPENGSNDVNNWIDENRVLFTKE